MKHGVFLALDPSSTATGWAVVPASGIIDADAFGVITTTASWPGYARVRSMQGEAAELIRSYAKHVDRIVVEVPGTKQAGRKREKFATPGVYAAAVGSVLAHAWATGLPVVAVASDAWTAAGGWGVKKADRIGTLIRCYHAYAVFHEQGRDPGGDAGDAITMGCWYAKHHGKEDNESCTLTIPRSNITGSRPYTSGSLATGSGGSLELVKLPRKRSR